MHSAPLDLEPFEQPMIFLKGDLLNLRLVPRPLVAAFFQYLIQQQKTVLFPQKRLHPIRPFPTEEEQTSLKRVQLELVLDDGRKSRD